MDLEITQKELNRARAYADALKTDLDQMRRQIAEYQEEIARLNKTLRHAKDANPVQRPSLKRVMRLAIDACMEVSRVAGGWLLKFGKLTRRFRNLHQIWLIFMADSWYLSDVFPPQKEPQAPPPAQPRLPFRAPVLAAKVSVSTA